MDLDRTDAFLDLWMDDCSWDLGHAGNTAVWKGKDAIRELMTGPGHKSITTRSQHLILNFAIEVNGDSATAVGYYVVTVRWQAGYGMFRSGMRTFRLKKVDGRGHLPESQPAIP